MGSPAYRRVLIKISGEGLCAPGGSGIDARELDLLGNEIAAVVAIGTQLGIVVGGGNFVRGAALSSSTGIEPTTAHFMGMLATLINALALADVLESKGVAACVQSALAVEGVCERYVPRKAKKQLDNERVVILAAGTGNPFVTTDTAAALRATELGCDLLLKATKVDGVYTSDPARDPGAQRLEHLSFDEVIKRRLEVMDLPAVDLCRQAGIPIIVCSLREPGRIKSVAEGRKVGTTIDGS